MIAKRRLRSDAAAALLFLAPSGIGFALFYLIPFAMAVYDSFINGAASNRFVGLENYRELLISGSFRKAASNTFYFTMISVPPMVGLSLGLALLMNRDLFARNGLRTAYVLPLVVPVASVVFVWQMLLDWNGSLNAWLGHLGIARVDWMKTDTARYAIAAVSLWKNIGYNMIIFLAGLQQIPKDYYETARMEGAGRFRQFRSITLVYVTPTMFLVVIMSIINSFKVFREAYLIAGDYPHDSIYMLQHYMNNMFMSMDIQKLTAAAALMAGCMLLLTLGLFALERRFRQFID
ncbi:sugar ABC transporter permease [Paenibacillus doosanensis]|uniref:L-arabinose transport system permease protein AraP n=1 Tax=Paenibacillus konkukensis TaxID=2020716 RepID=A0ABY4RGE7_9BACL|nr:MULTISPECIES: sugar ABC transporter permease [Paenibacillus]MCS7461360.1 sugar ABC transporter permease [Paenibacillus doosanensis]UQZ81125.1 L-arabinose transport system permease protein AraP [Paenibacillus konkukensis]